MRTGVPSVLTKAFDWESLDQRLKKSVPFSERGNLVWKHMASICCLWGFSSQVALASKPHRGQSIAEVCKEQKRIGCVSPLHLISRTQEGVDKDGCIASPTSLADEFGDIVSHRSQSVEISWILVRTSSNLCNPKVSCRATSGIESLF